MRWYGKLCALKIGSWDARAARVYLGRLLQLEGVQVVGYVLIPTSLSRPWLHSPPSFRLRREVRPRLRLPIISERSTLIDAERIGDFTPLSGALPAGDGCVAGGRLTFIEKPLSTNVQEAADIVGLAVGGIGRGRGGASSIRPPPAWSSCVAA